MANDQNEIALGIASLRANFLSRLRTQAQDAEEHARAIFSGAYRSDDVEGVRRCAHRIAGTAATFGFPRLGDVAQRLDGSLLQNVSALSQAQIDLIAEFLSVAREVIEDRGGPAAG